MSWPSARQALLQGGPAVAQGEEGGAADLAASAAEVAALGRQGVLAGCAALLARTEQDFLDAVRRLAS